MASIEEKVEDFYKNKLDQLGIRRYNKTEIFPGVTEALKNAESKSGGSGRNYPDIQFLLDNGYGRRIPVMLEAKGSKGALVKPAKDGSIELLKEGAKNPYSVIQKYAVNGALHYGLAVLDGKVYHEVLIIGVNGTTADSDGIVSDPECEVYYVADKNSRMPKKVEILSDISKWDLMREVNVGKLFEALDQMSLTEKERERIKQQTEQTLEAKVKAIHQSIYDDPKMRTTLDTNGKLYLFCGLIMAGIPIPGARDLEPDDLRSNDNAHLNDGTEILRRVEAFLSSREATQDKIDMIKRLFTPTFQTEKLWKPADGMSILKDLYTKVKTDIIPLFSNGVNLDFTGRILNSLSDWAAIADDRQNDVVLTPRYVTKMMAIMARTNRDSLVWDSAMGSAGFLVSAMDLMIRDAEENITDKDELAAKIKNIKQHQLLGIEILGPVFVLAVLNMILMGDGSSNILQGDSHSDKMKKEAEKFPANVYLLNPPYSAEGKGFIFVEEALEKMTEGYACILIQENAGSGQGLPYTKRILQKNTLLASIHMPGDLFGGKASVQASIYVFKVAQPHDPDHLVTFIDMSEDGYTRQNRKKSTQEVNLRNTDHADERYAEVEAIVLGKKPKTEYYTEKNGKVIRDTVTLNGDDWTFNDHKTVDTMPTEEDFKKTVADYLSWKVGQLMKGAANAS